MAQSGTWVDRAAKHGPIVRNWATQRRRGYLEVQGRGYSGPNRRLFASLVVFENR